MWMCARGYVSVGLTDRISTLCESRSEKGDSPSLHLCRGQGIHIHTWMYNAHIVMYSHTHTNTHAHIYTHKHAHQYITYTHIYT